jgi:Ca-activated chloride channel family protein
MRCNRWLFAVLVWIVGTLGCSGRLPQAPVSAAPATKPDKPKTARVQNQSFEGSDQLPPMGMEAVLAETDGLLEQRAGSDWAVDVAGGGDRSTAPYLFVPGADDASESLPLKSTSARVNVTGVIAQVEVTQVYQNRGTTPIEAVYVFPASTRAAVHGMRMTIGERVIIAKIEKRDKAREEYGAAKQQGKRASLLEQERSNVFTMNVANIMPGDVIKTELMYSELIVPEDGTYSFVYPTVVGPRNPMGADPATHGWVGNPHLPSGMKEPYRFDIQVQLRSPIPLKAVSSPSHQVKVTYPSPKAASVELTEPGGGNRDFVLSYKLRGDQIQTGTLVYDQGGEKFFLMMMEPPQRVAPSEVVPREYVFVLDVSGSMNGYPLWTAKQLMKDLLSNLKPSEYFNVVTFAGQAGVLSPRSLPATVANVQQALGSVESLSGGGGTNLMDALRTSYALPRPTGQSMSRSVVVITDGYVAVEPQAFRFIRKRLGEANLFSFGIGSSINRGLIEGMARAGMGSPFVVLRGSEAPSMAAKFREYIESPLLTNVQLSFQGLDVYDVIPQKLPDLMAQRPLIAFGKYRGAGQGTIEVVGSQASGAFKQQVLLDTGAASAQNRPLRSLWARSWVEELMDQHAALGGAQSTERAVTHLGLKYGLLTQFTSFVAIDSQVANTQGGAVTVRQPLPMPQGVTNSALSGGKVVVESSSLVILSAVQFKHRGSTIDATSHAILDQVVEVLKENPELRLGVYGYSDREGSSAETLRLSQQRAAAVARYLTEHGIDAKRLDVQGFGDQHPLADSQTEEGRAKNRRVEFKILQ